MRDEAHIFRSGVYRCKNCLRAIRRDVKMMGGGKVDVTWIHKEDKRVICWPSMGTSAEPTSVAVVWNER